MSLKTYIMKIGSLFLESEEDECRREVTLKERKQTGDGEREMEGRTREDAVRRKANLC